MFEDYIRKLDDKNLQLVLTKTDTDILTKAMAGTTDYIKAKILNNMSERVKNIILEDLSFKNDLSEDEIIEAQQIMVNIINGLKYNEDIILSDEPLTEVNYDIESILKLNNERIDADDFSTLLSKEYKGSPEDYKDIINIMARFAEISRKDGLLALEDYLLNVKEEMIKKGLQYVTDGIDTELVRFLMERYKKTIIEKTEKKLDIIIEGIISIQAGENPDFVREKLNLFIDY